MHRTIPPPPPPKDLFFDFAKQKQQAADDRQAVKAMPVEELTELLDDDLEEWAKGGTRILPKTQTLMGQPTPVSSPLQSFPPVAYGASMPPPPVVAKSSALVWAGIFGMTSVFALAAIAGLVFLVHASHASTEDPSTSNATTTTTTTNDVATTQAAPPPPPPVVTTVAPLATLTAPPVVQTTTPHTTTTTTTAPVVTNKPLGAGMLQTFAAGNGKPILVDGKQIGVGGSHVKTACGKHSISVGTGRAHTYDVPCTGGTITVGSPDGT